uniref:Uncharacterized protein n=1 Tax=Geobacter sp. (strain M21) TaxID=443144 RepID=C6E4I7_GEOSM
MFNSIYSKYIQRLAVDLDAKFCPSGELEVVADQNKFKMYLFPASEGQLYIPAYFQLKTEISQTCGCFSVRRSDLMDWVAENIFFKQDYQVGDESFDSQFFITVKDDKQAIKFFSKKQIRIIVSDLLSNDFHKVYVKDSELVVIRYAKSRDDFPSMEMINTAIRKIQLIRDISRLT